ncbi:MAG: cell envelope integrity protein CreD [Bacteroidetes bacterium]|jgi:inner membrane protein|nr:cell envelope integrity protein CreD [Bacteroidota bacterium]
MKSLKNSVFVKVLSIVLIILLLLIPTAMIKGLIHERESVRATAIAEVSGKWANEQVIKGPILAIPYTKHIPAYLASGQANGYTPVKEFIHLLPNDLSISGQIETRELKRGIYEVVVYESNLALQGSFDMKELENLDIPMEDIAWENSELVLHISDMRGIEEQVALDWNGNATVFNPGLSNPDADQHGIHAPLQLQALMEGANSFSLDLQLKGSQKLYVVPVGKVTTTSFSTNWHNPSYNGAFLPDDRGDGPQGGHSADWKVLNLNRAFPQVWTGSHVYLDDAAFGVDLLLPVDQYQKSYRSIQYAILFIGFTFLSFFFIEVLNKVSVHPVQYLLVGMAMVVFYTLLLSMSEHLGFDLSFGVSAVATLVLIAFYVRAALKSLTLSLLITSILCLLYAFNFVIIQLQDFALLIGSIGLFAILATVMFFSRKIDWYSLKVNDKT